MADDVNNSGKPINGSSGRINPKLQGEIQKRNAKISMAEGDIPERIANMAEKYGVEEDKYNEINKLMSMSTDASTKALIQKELVSQAEKVALARESYEQSHIENANAANRELAKRISTHTSYYNVNKRTTTTSSDQEFFRRSKDPSILQTPTEVLQERKERLMNQASEMGEEIVGGIRRLKDSPDVDDTTRERIEKLSKLEDEISLTKRAIKTQAKYGMTTEKRQYAAEETLSKAGSILGASSLAKDVAAGRYGDIDKETENLKKMFETLTATLAKFEEVSENATDAQGNLTEEYKKVSKDLNDIQKETDKQRQVIAEINKQGGGGRDGIDLQSGVRTFRKISDMSYAIDQQDVMEETRLKTGMAGRAVQQYNRVNSAIGGDMSALLREAGGQEFVKSYSDRIRGSAMRQASLNIGLTAADTATEIAGNTVSVNAIASPVTAAQKDVEALGLGAASTFRQGMALARGIPQTQRALEASQTAEGFVNTMQAIDASTLQSFYDQNMAARTATIGRGSTAGESDLTDVTTLRGMAGAGLSPGRAAQLAAMSTAALGGSGSIIQTTRRAGAIEMGRSISAEQFIGLSGQMAGIGGGSQDLEEIMKNAVAAGMDNAKNIQQMVSVTTSMSSGLAKLGAAGGTAVGDMLGASTQRLRASGVNENLATGAAASAIDFQNRNSTSLNLNMGAIYERNKLRSIYGPLDTVAADRMASLSQEDYAQLAGKQGREYANTLGISSIVTDASGNVDLKKLAAARNADKKSLMINNGGGVGMFSPEEMAKFEKGEYSDRMKQYFSVQGVNVEGFSKGDFAVNKGKVKEGPQGATDSIAIAQANQQAKVFASGKDQIKSMDNLAAAINALVESGISDPKKAQERVVEAADKMKEPEAFKELSSASTALQDAANKLSNYADKSGQGGHVPTNLQTTPKDRKTLMTGRP